MGVLDNIRKFRIHFVDVFEIMKYVHEITVFTPTYNREKTLSRLYNSLKNQTNKSFEWLIIDDGSIDNTQNLIEAFIAEGILAIRYYKKENGGKHRAINFGLELAKGELFFIVDSDDFLPSDSIQIILNKYVSISDQVNIAGLSGRKGYLDGTYIGSNFSYSDKVCNALDFRFQYKIQGDMAEVFKTKVLKKFPFPDIIGEKFCPEALVWNRIAREYDILWFSTIIYTAEYLDGGLTSRIVEIRMKSPYASSCTYLELSNSNISFIQSLKACINYWRFAYNIDDIKRKEVNKPNMFLSIIGKPIGKLMHLKDLKTVRI